VWSNVAELGPVIDTRFDPHRPHLSTPYHRLLRITPASRIAPWPLKGQAEKVFYRISPKWAPLNTRWGPLATIVRTLGDV
jgi:hypothetical protein